ncbi:MAG: hypothetical protein LBH44_14090 [Treponema sp.]|nr:hypothetical protein [Treponema sp.]
MKRFTWVLICLAFAVLLSACGSSPAKVAEPDLTGVTSYYVRANGSDSNAGTSEDAPFKTLARALEAASKTPVKKITLMGTFSINKESCININNTGPDEILVMGKPNANENEKAVIKGHGTLIVLKGNSNIRLEYITLHGEIGPNNAGSRGIIVEQDATLTLGRDAVITKFNMANIGVGIYLEGTLFMTENAIITDNGGRIGGGLMIKRGNATMRDDAAIINNTPCARDSGGGGVAVVENGTLTMQDRSSIAGNEAENGGGVLIDNGTLVMKDNATILNNISSDRREGWGGGGVAINGYGTLTMQDNSSIAGNKAENGGGVSINRGTLTMEDNAIIKNNEATGGVITGGGGISICWDGEAILKDNSLVTENKASYGGGVYTKSKDIEFTGGSIRNSYNHEHTFQTGNIRGNIAENGTDIYENYH